MSKTYRDAGVDIEKGDRFADFIRNHSSRAVASSIGGFAGGFEVDLKAYERPVIMTTTDGVGTKLMIAQKLGVYDTVGIDLVAMCVNDLIASGADPVSFLDYIACGKIDESLLQELVKGIIEGCDRAGCVLSGGETAEMPDMYGPNDFDLAGFAVGIVNKESVLPAIESVSEGAVLFGMQSSGIHSNGFSLARKALPMDNRDILKELLVPTRIYVKDLRDLIDTGLVIGAAHITGGGLEGNIRRILPIGLVPQISYSWDVPWIFQEMETTAGIEKAEMRKVFNLGIGMVVCVDGDNAADFADLASGTGLIEIGVVAKA
jgi:phosphoribosylformylglycinamidine cyclo-ligase